MAENERNEDIIKPQIDQPMHLFMRSKFYDDVVFI